MKLSFYVSFYSSSYEESILKRKLRPGSIMGAVTGSSFLRKKKCMRVLHGSNYWEQLLQTKHVINPSDHGKNHARLAENTRIKHLLNLW
jgi:hypothetical protein